MLLTSERFTAMHNRSCFSTLMPIRIVQYTFQYYKYVNSFFPPHNSLFSYYTFYFFLISELLSNGCLSFINKKSCGVHIVFYILYIYILLEIVGYLGFIFRRVIWRLLLDYLTLFLFLSFRPAHGSDIFKGLAKCFSLLRYK